MSNQLKYWRAKEKENEIKTKEIVVVAVGNVGAYTYSEDERCTFLTCIAVISEVMVELYLIR